MVAVFAAVAALDHRDRTGQGQHLDVAQMEAMLNFTGTAVLDYSVNERTQVRAGNRLMGGDEPETAPHAVFPTKGDDRWIAIAVFSDAEWQTLCRTLGRDDWISGDDFATLPARCHNEGALNALIAGETRRYDARELMERLQAAGVTAGVVLDQEGLYADPQLAHRGHFVSMPHPVLGDFPAELFGARLESTPPRVQRPAPCLGEHNELVLRELLGYSTEDFDRLVAEGAVEFYGGD
jgi:benzylsuccinate CoA-transferase BbsF subunit